jgi:DNA helicase IV
MVKQSTTNTVSRNQNIPVVAMMAADDAVSKEFPDFIQIIQKQGIITITLIAHTMAAWSMQNLSLSES